MKNIFNVLFFVLVQLTILPTVVFASETKLAHKQEGNFVNGAKLWANQCSSCHNMRDAKELTDKQWQTVMLHMRIRSGLTGQEVRDVLKFLQSSN